MKLLAPHDRPREKLGRLGAAALGDNELLAAGLDHGSQYEGALEVANRVLDLAGGVHGLTRVLDGRLRRITGVGPATAARILAVIELGCPRDVAADLLPRYGARSVKQFGVVLLDTRHRVVRVSVLSVGTLDASLVHPREVFRAARPPSSCFTTTRRVTRRPVETMSS